MNNVERYLRLATWGLWGEHKRTVRMELASHIHHKANQYEALGYTPSAAISRALNDLGPPHVVSAGMNGVYTMPNILRNTLLCAVIATLGVGNLTSSVAQVASTSRVPIAQCASGQSTFDVGKDSLQCDSTSLWVNVPSLRVTLESKGVTFTQPIGSPKVGGAYYLRFPGASFDATLTPELRIGFRAQDGTSQLLEANPDFIRVTQFLAVLRQTGLPVQITGWSNPRVIVGTTTFTLETKEQPLQSGTLQRDAINRAQLEALFPPLLPRPKTSDLEDELIQTTLVNPFIGGGISQVVAYQYKIRVKDAKPDDVLIVLSREGPFSFNIIGQTQPLNVQNVRRALIVPVNADGTISYISPSKKLLVSRSGDLPRSVIDGDGTISVLRFSGRIDLNATDTLTRVAPEDVAVEAVK